MSFKELTYVMCIAKHQNITKAAKELYITQPTLSKFLQKLESDLGTKLFHHTDNRYIPTYVGKRYLDYAVQIMALKKDWDEELADMLKLNSGELGIAFPIMRSTSIIPATLPLFHQKYPNIKVNLYEETSFIEQKLLFDDKVDLTIFNETIHHPKLECHTLGYEETLLAVPGNHPLATRGTEIPELSYPWIDIKLFENESFILHYAEQHTGQVSTS